MGPRQDLIWRLEGLGFAAFVGFMRLLGVERASALGGWLLRTLGPKTGTQKTVMRNLRIAFPEMPPEERERLALNQWEQTGRAFAETAVMDRLVAEGMLVRRRKLTEEFTLDDFRALNPDAVLLFTHDGTRTTVVGEKATVPQKGVTLVALAPPRTDPAPTEDEAEADPVTRDD